MHCKLRFSPRLLPRSLSWPCTLVFSVGAVSTGLYWRKNLYASALTSERLSCCLLTSAACLWATPGSALPCSLRCPPQPCSTRYLPVLTPCLDRCFALTSPILRRNLRTQSLDALFSIVLKPPTGVFYDHWPATDRRFSTPDRWS